MARHRNDDEDRRDDRRGRRRDRDDWDDGPRSGRRRDEPRHSPAANVLVLAVAGSWGCWLSSGPACWSATRSSRRPRSRRRAGTPGPRSAKADARGAVWPPNVYLALHPHLYKYALAHGSKLPGSAADLAAFKHGCPDLFAHLESGR